MSGRDRRLADAVAALERSIAAAERAAARDLAQLERNGLLEGLTVEDMRDATGRPLLLDARAALVVGLAALPEPMPDGVLGFDSSVTQEQAEEIARAFNRKRP